VIRATLDTNVLVSGLAGLAVPTSTPGTIIENWLDGAFELVISADILAELERTLTKPYYRSRRSQAEIEAAKRLIAAKATVIVPTIAVTGVATHPEDDLVLAAAASARVDYLVTGDKQLQRLGSYQRVTMISPRAFLDLLELTCDEVR
jgi:putative PIN family toxin of toxin-antitoxin system